MLYGLLDYDGFICKAYYASISRGTGDIEDIEKVLNDLTQAAIAKVVDMDENFDIKMIVSGHTYKKDIYPSYKQSRKKDEYLGVFRDYILNKYKNKLIRVPQLEADDVITMMYNKLEQTANDAIVISDDKDLRYYNPFYCKINITEQPKLYDNTNQKFIQMLSGDKEDNIKGVTGIGETKAKKLLDKKSYTMKSVIEVYKESDADIDHCLKELVLVTPIHPDYVEDYKYGFTDTITINNILGHFRYFNKLVQEVYKND